MPERKIRIYSQKDMIDESTMENFDKSAWVNYMAYFGKFSAISTGVRQLANGLIYLFVALKAYAGAFPVGNIILYVGAIMQFANGFASLLTNIGELSSNAVYLEKIQEFLDRPNKKYLGSIPIEKRDDNDYEIEFHNVSFKYPGSESYVLKKLSFKMQIGQRLAVVGMNGSGKTTMIKLLCRLYDPSEGEITLNGIDIKKYNYEEYMAIFSVVFQDFKLLPFSLGQNVAASMNYEPEAVSQALLQSGFEERLKNLPKGLDSHIYKNFEEEGVEISGGEAQKIALARALYKNAPFIILDEPTAALDPLAEYEIYSAFDDIRDGKTAVFISHRLSSCRFCDDIAVFHEGEIVQRGSHELLIADRAGKYSELWNAQAQYYNG